MATPGCCFAQLLCCPCIAWGPGYRGMDDKSCFQFQDHKDEEMTKQQVIHHSEIASPDVASIVLEENRPGLTRRVLSLGKISLDCALAYPNTHLQQLSPDLFCSPKSVLVSHLLDQVEGFG
jgi:hypothetical protein